MFRIFFVFLTILCLGFQSTGHSATRLTAVKVEKKPIIDGYQNDAAWAMAPEIITRDPIADLDVALKAVHTDKEVFFLVRFADPDESRIHKAWVWNHDLKIYKMGPLREDSFVFKWAMEKATSDLSIHADKDYKADLWFWKANRTDQAGYADDKHQLLSLTNIPGSKLVTSRAGKTMFLKRNGDAGKPAYKNQLYIEYAGDIRAQFLSQTPSGSRADIRAKGIWSDREWCIEFARKMVTGNSDDVQFEVGKEYLFGISRYEIAGRKPDPNTSQPLYGAGDILEKLFLVFEK